MSSREIEIRPLHEPAELRQCQEVQRRAWGIVEDGYLVPVATLAAVATYGGLVLGAVAGGRVVGFSFAFRGVLGGTPVLYSQLTGVLPEAQGSGVGRRIKTAQRQWAWEQGLPYVAWAFDPLQVMNAHYNITVLGATVTHYHENFYGTREDALNPGLPTDRVIAVWSTTAPAPTPEKMPPLVPSGLAHAPPAPDILTAEGSEALRHLLLASVPAADGTRDPAPCAWRAARQLSIEVPADLRILRSEPERVGAWQGAVRAAFTRAFAAGYVGVAFVRGERPHYVLARGER